MKETQTINEIEVSYKPITLNIGSIKITSSRDAYYALKKIFPSLNHVEYFYSLFLNNSNKIIGYQQISKGGFTSTVVDIRVIMQTALKTNAVSIIIAHNHPSGTLKPSQQDNKLTNKIKAAGETLDIKILDHLIITEESYFSYADEMQL